MNDNDVAANNLASSPSCSLLTYPDIGRLWDFSISLLLSDLNLTQLLLWCQRFLRFGRSFDERSHP